MFNRSEVMTKAWAIYRSETQFSRPVHAKDRRRLFAQCLASAWGWAKERAAEAAKSPEQRRVERIEALKSAIHDLVYLPAHMNYQRRYEALSTELRTLEAA